MNRFDRYKRSRSSRIGKVVKGTNEHTATQAHLSIGLIGTSLIHTEPLNSDRQLSLSANQQKLQTQILPHNSLQRASQLFNKLSQETLNTTKEVELIHSRQKILVDPCNAMLSGNSINDSKSKVYYDE